jgi:hypothetical protein
MPSAFRLSPSVLCLLALPLELAAQPYTPPTPSRTDPAYYVEAADILDGPWTNSPTRQVLTDDGTMQILMATDPVSTTDASQRFLRVRLTRP